MKSVQWANATGGLWA